MTGTTVIVPQYYTSVDEQSAVRLARYAQLIGYDENPFWGINHNVGDNVCRYIWTLDERMMAAKYLAEAQSEIEDVLHFKIGYQWVQEVKRPLKCPMLAQWGYLVEFGIMALSNVGIGATVDYTADPAVIGPIATTVTDPGEIAVFHPGTSLEITPGTVVIAGGNVTITIPWCRLVKPSYADNPEDGYQYNDKATWGEATLDIKRRYNDPSTNAVVSTNHACSAACFSSGCAAYSHDACGYIKSPRIGHVEIFLSDYTNGAWVRECNDCCGYDEVVLNYLCGVPMTRQHEDMIVRLAHSKMPRQPCGCDPIKALWERDRMLPQVYSRERINCDFGMTDGAWTAWRWANALALKRGGIVG